MNDFWEIVEKFINFIGELVERFTKKKNDTLDALEVRSEIKTCENLVNRSYMAIGRKYYEMHKDGEFDPEFEKQFREIANASKAIEDLKGTLEDIKNS